LTLAQQDVPSNGRVVVKKVLPAYPAVAKRMSLGGVVKVEVTIDPKGSVKSTKIVGGSPVLASAAEEAIRRWQFQPGPDTNTQVVEFKFDPQN
jgi:TonB family protein